MIRVLGCFGSIAARCHTTSFLLDDDILIDAGSGVGELRLDELARIDHVLVTHSHLDHVLSIPLLADTVIKLRMGAGLSSLRPIHVHALPETLAALRAHIFNGVIWPDFTRLPSAQHPILVFHEFAVGEVLRFPPRTCGRRLTPCPPSVSASRRRRAGGCSPATPGPTRLCGTGCKAGASPTTSSKPP